MENETIFLDADEYFAKDYRIELRTAINAVNKGQVIYCVKCLI